MQVTGRCILAFLFSVSYHKDVSRSSGAQAERETMTCCSETSDPAKSVLQILGCEKKT